jgi:hypothetical protein
MLTDGSLADIASSPGPLPLAVGVDEEGGQVSRWAGRFNALDLIRQAMLGDHEWSKIVDVDWNLEAVVEGPPRHHQRRRVRVLATSQRRTPPCGLPLRRPRRR